jgi:hypothetical protein
MTSRKEFKPRSSYRKHVNESKGKGKTTEPKTVNAEE